MRTTNYLLANLKEEPTEAELVSHKLMLRAGLIRKLASGVYSWLPTGLRVLRKVERIVREELDKAGCLEMLLPSVQPAELWQESGRWEQYGPELLRFKDRHDRDFCYGPTHEEVITEVLRRDLKSYKQLPLNVYQIQTKFRDEIRPRFGVMRAREFTMKDAYSFHIDEKSLAETYQVMFDAYTRIFERMGLSFRAVQADSGAIGGDRSHEFQVLADSGEDLIAYSDGSDYAANIEKAETLINTSPRPTATANLKKVSTPTQRTIKDVCEFLSLPEDKSVKVLLVNGVEDDIVALVLRGDHQLNEIKAEHHPKVATPLTFADEAVIERIIKCQTGFIGPIGLTTPIIVDHAAAQLNDFCCGANEEGMHYVNANWGRDMAEPDMFDLRNVVEGDASPDGKGTLKLTRGVEVGHIFQLGTKYSDAMKANVLNDGGKAVNLQMGCYGLGISRVVAASIEQHHDDHGIIWPEAIAPFHIMLVPMNYHKSHRVREAADALYEQLLDAGYEVLFDDRKERPGVLFATADLIGIPHRIVISESGIDAGTVEYKRRTEKDNQTIVQTELLSFLSAS